MNRKGFTLTEVLVTVVILGVLVSVAMPQYMRAVERSRATEAMSAIKSINDAIYVYYSDKEACPTKFTQLAVTVSPDLNAPNSSLASKKVDTKFFTFILEPRNVPLIPGTTCKGALAKRRNGGDYQYGIYNPFKIFTDQAYSLACSTAGDTTSSIEKSKALCESLGIYKVVEIIDD